jgi:putative colanic acid biosysnthesis UDP-glucose lipid carrier transferase
MQMSTDPSFLIPLLEDIVASEIKTRARSYIDDKKGYFIFKRIFDIIISLLIIATILSWLLPLLALLIKLDSRGPVFFLQKRVGKGGRSFLCYKFRSMILNVEADKKQAVENDHRITRLGKFLRKSNLDELPQFFNVLKGEMSIVGPRPHMYADCNRFSAQVPAYKLRNLIRPGITGLAQTKGFSGPAIHFEEIFRRYQWDAYYVRAANFWLDLKIIRKTICQHMNSFFLNTPSSKPSPGYPN